MRRLRKPTRISCDKRDWRGYRAFALLNATGRPFTIYLNGVPVRAPLSADTKRGTVRRYVTTADGNLACTPSGDVLVEKVRGHVVIKVQDAQA